MKRKIFLQLIICFLFSSTVFGAMIASNQAQGWVEDKGHSLIKIFSETDLSQKHSKLDNFFINYVDMEYIAKFVIGKHYKDMSPEQREIYFPLFKRYALAVYKNFPLYFGEEVDFEVVNVLPKDKSTNVFTEISITPEQKIIIEFVLLGSNNQIKIADIKLAEISLILAYRNRFNEMVMQNDGDISWFLEDLEMITKSTEKTNREKIQ